MKTFKEALSKKQEDTNLEYELRAVRIVKWYADKENLSNETTELLYEELVERLAIEDDEWDIALSELLNEILYECESE